jgi:hypothetical protein
MSEAPFRRPSRGGGGGSKGRAPRVSAGPGSARPVGGRRPGFGKSMLLTEHGQSGSWLSRSRPGNRTVRRERQRASAVVSPGLRIAENADASQAPHPRAPFRVRGMRLLLAYAASTVWPLGVGDAGNGYPAWSWTVASRRSRASASGGPRQVAANATAQAARPRAGGTRVLVTTEVGCRNRHEASFPVRPRANSLLARPE